MRHRSSSLSTYLTLATSMSISGSLSVVGKLMLASFPVILASHLSLIFSALGMWLIHRLFYGPLPRLNRRQFYYLFLQTLFGVFLFRLFFFYGLLWSSAATAGLLLSLTPVAVLLLSLLMLGETLTRRRCLGIVCCAAGLLLSQYRGSVSANRSTFFGLALLLLAVFCEAMFTIFRKKLAFKPLAPWPANTYVLIIGSLLFLPISASSWATFPFVTLSWQAWLPIAYTVVAVNMVGFTLWFRGVDRVSASIAGAFTVFMPVSSVVLAALILGEAITSATLAGLGLIIVGLLLVVRRRMGPATGP